MTSPGAGLHDHRIALFIECRAVVGDEVKRLPALGFADLARQAGAPRWIDPARLDPKGKRSLAERKLWDWAPFAISHDLEPSISAILAAAPAPVIPAKAGALKLSEYGRHLLAGRYRPGPEDPGGPHPQRLVLTLGPASLRRLERDPKTALELRIEEVALIPFATEVAILLVEVKLVLVAGGALDAPLLTEAVHVLSDERPPRPPCLHWSPLPDEPPAEFRLSDLLQPLFGDRAIRLRRERRIYSYCTALLADPLSESDRHELAFRLSRRYNAGYAPRPESGGTEFYQPFVDVLHAASLEGAATIVNAKTRETGDAAPEFLTNWLGTAYGTAYLPIVLVLFHQHLALLDLAQQAAVDIDFSQFEEVQADELRWLCDRFLALRLRYRPAQVSGITMHNRFADCLSRSLGLDALSRKAAQDAFEAEASLSRYAAERAADATAAAQKREAARERRWAWHGAIISAALAVLAVLSLTKGLGETVRPAYEWLAHGKAMSKTDMVNLASLALAFFLGAIGFFVTRGRVAAPHEAATEINEQAETLHIIEASRDH
ncbi:MAG TPA: hypothetical protein VLX85_02610 [Stellaceae bacterium]|nr:hypothetical protein [Stellaceae bacterium]